jgi:hypothetical protein
MITQNGIKPSKTCQLEAYIHYLQTVFHYLTKVGKNINVSPSSFLKSVKYVCPRLLDP